jgi:starvation-inducible outer membrane lipoprotein
MHARVLLAFAAALALSACATRPESISASYVSHEKYAGLDCERLNTRMSDARSNLEKFSQMQNTKANVDAATVFLALIPLSKLSGDSAADVAKWKGEVEAIETAQIRAGCKSAG